MTHFIVLPKPTNARFYVSVPGEFFSAYTSGLGVKINLQIAGGDSKMLVGHKLKVLV
jgi:hypothetical protein